MQVHSATPTLVGHRDDDSLSTSMKSLQSGPSTPTSSSAGNDVEKGELAHQYAGLGTERDPYVVKFSEGDAENPLNFKASRKWWIVVNVGMTTLCTLDSAASGSVALRFSLDFLC